MKALIIDDEPLPAKDLAFMIEKHCSEISSIEICLSASKALNILKRKSYNVLFLDIEMPEMTGFELMKLTALPEETKLIITTAYEQYALEAFNANAIHYLVKPVNTFDLIKGVRKVHQEFTKSIPTLDSVISVYDNDEHHIIQEMDIIRAEAEGNYTNFYLKGRKLVSSKNLGFYQKSLSKQLFFRTHRSHIINLKMVSKLNKGKAGLIFLSDGSSVPLTSSKHEDLEIALGLK